MKNIELCKINIGDLQEISLIAGIGFEKYREYKDGYHMVQDKERVGNFVHVSNQNHAATIRLNFSDATKAPSIIENLKSKYPLDFSYYHEIINKVNPIYMQNSFFNETLKVPYANDTWDQFIPTKRKRRLSEDFSRNIKILHISFGNSNSRMVLKHKLALVNIKLPSGRTEYVPVLKFTLPISRMTTKTIIVSASTKYEFMFYLHNRNMVYLERSELDQFMEKLNKSVVTHIYNSLKTSIGMDDIRLKDFKQFDDDERERFMMVSKMLKV